MRIYIYILQLYTKSYVYLLKDSPERIDKTISVKQKRVIIIII